MPVIFHCPDAALPGTVDNWLETARPKLEQAGWHMVRPGVKRPECHLRTARAAGRDLLLITPDIEHLSAPVLTEMAQSPGGRVDVDVVLAIADPGQAKIRALCDAAQGGQTWTPDRAISRLSGSAPLRPSQEQVAALLANGLARVHALPMANLAMDPISYLVHHMLGLSVAAPEAFEAQAALLRADAHRLIATCLWRDGSVASAPERAARIANIGADVLDALQNDIRDLGAVARRALRHSEDGSAQSEIGALNDQLRGHWTVDPRVATSKTTTPSERVWHDPDALLSLGKIARKVDEILATLEDSSVSSAPPQSPQVATGAGVPQILVLGHSHIGALDLAWKGAPDRYAPTRFRCVHLNSARLRPNFTVGQGPRRITPAFQDALAEIMRDEAPDLVVALPMGNEYNALAMAPVGPPFSFRWPEEKGGDVDPDTWDIPIEMIRAQVRALADRNALLMFAAIEASAPCPVLALPPPPPIRDAAHIQAFPGRFAAAIDRTGLNPADLRGRFWRLYCEVLSDALADSAVTLLALPDAVFETHGGQRFLNPDMRAKDPTHGNAAYGGALLDTIMAQLDVHLAVAA